MFCTHCGAQVTAETRFCPQCGTTLGGAPPPPPPVFAPAASFTVPAGCQAHTGRWIGAAWTLVTAQLGMFALIIIVMSIVSAVVPLILQGPMLAGIHIVCWRVVLGGRADLGDLFKGFNFFVPSLAACIVIAVFSFLGLFACIVGALVVVAMYQFTYLLIIDRKLDFWPAMQASHAIVKQDYFGFTIFLLALIGIQILGALACLVGLLVTLPIYYAAITVAYKELVGFASPAPPQ
ncbi:MAG: zinc-ribbon domain-containing protein [Candidatus Solibacter usitatus]|nr:zinc-ribbon domain-containing protein [Candidatus Solibacter usitatus]